MLHCLSSTFPSQNNMMVLDELSSGIVAAEDKGNTDVTNTSG